VVLLDEQNDEYSMDVAGDGSYLLGGMAEGDYQIRVEPSGTDLPYTASIPEEITLSNPVSAERSPPWISA
jgi:hypothetical protein